MSTRVAVLAIMQISTADSLTSQAVLLVLVCLSVLVPRSIMVVLAALYVIIRPFPQSRYGDAAQADRPRSLSFLDS